ncbi:hypothetical protein EDD17DRAFT_1627997 [Pisolithus thermaeus]|nr:hypothetical protein EDD17DRAFT_1627997 [Pisolithus thermaeus]
MWVGEFHGPDPFSLFRGENPTAAAAGFHHPGHNSGFGRVEGAVQAFDTRDFCEIHGAHDLATLNHRLRLSRMVRAAANAQATRPGAGKAIYREKKCRRGTCVLRNLQSGHAVSHVPRRQSTRTITLGADHCRMCWTLGLRTCRLTNHCDRKDCDVRRHSPLT